MIDNLQVLRTIDKADRDPPPVIFDKLTTGYRDRSGAFVKGCGLSAAQAAIIVSFVQSGDTAISRRFALITKLEETIVAPGVDNCGVTAWDRLLAMRQNADETWRDGGRPANIAWALDDLVGANK